MTDLEQGVRELLRDRSSRGEIDPRLSSRVARRARRRQIGIGAVVTVTVAAMLAGILGVVAYVRSAQDDGPIPASVGPLRTVTLPTGTITYPERWYLVEWPGANPKLQLTNFDPAFTQPCFTGDAVDLPPNGVLLLTDPTNAGPDELGLTRDPSPSACRPGGLKEELAPGEPEHWSGSWDGGSANAMIGADASDGDREALFEAFASLVRPAGEPGPYDENISARLVLETIETPQGPWLLTVDLDTTQLQLAGRGGPVPIRTLLSMTGPPGVGRAGILLEHRIPEGDSGTTSMGADWGRVVWGTVTADAASAELRTAEGDAFPAALRPLPPSLGLEGQQTVWGVATTPTEGPVGTVLYDAEGVALNDPSLPPVVEERVTVATGVDPDNGPWELTLERTPDGIGLAFSFTDGGGGSGCCLSPLDGQDLVLDGFGHGDGRKSDITAIGSDALASVAFEAIDGTRVEGAVYDMPPNEEGIPKAALALVPEDVPLVGTLIGYDAAGAEIGRAPLGDRGEPPGPTPEIDEVWTLLRTARDSVLGWANDHGNSLEHMSLDAMTAVAPDIPWNASGAGKPVPNQVSIRGVMPAGGDEATGWSGWTVVLVSATPEGGIGQTFCVAVNVDDGGGGNFRYGLQDAATYEECRGGWERYL